MLRSWSRFWLGTSGRCPGAPDPVLSVAGAVRRRAPTRHATAGIAGGVWRVGTWPGLRGDFRGDPRRDRVAHADAQVRDNARQRLDLLAVVLGAVAGVVVGARTGCAGAHGCPVGGWCVVLRFTTFGSA